MATDHQYWLNETIQMAVDNVKNGGGPFAAIVVRNGEIVGRGVNSIQLTSDPTAHAELLAIQEACIKLQKTDLSDSILYASGEPCPMCTGAIYWSRPKAVYYACSKKEAGEAVNFPDPLVNYYTDLQKSPEQRPIPLHKVDSEQRLAPFEAWKKTAD